MTILGFIALPVALAGVGMLLVKRQIQAYDDRVHETWRRVQAAFERRHELARQIAAHSSDPSAPWLVELQAVLKQAEFTSGLAMKARVENHLSDALHAVVAQGGGPQFAKSAAELPEALETIQQAMADYNTRVRDYNARLARWETAARWLGYELRELFSLGDEEKPAS